jgi:hypothetical protein
MDTDTTPNYALAGRSPKTIRRKLDKYKRKYDPHPLWRPPVTVADIDRLLDRIDALKLEVRQTKARLRNATRR